MRKRLWRALSLKTRLSGFVINLKTTVEHSDTWATHTHTCTLLSEWSIHNVPVGLSMQWCHMWCTSIVYSLYVGRVFSRVESRQPTTYGYITAADNTRGNHMCTWECKRLIYRVNLSFCRLFSGWIAKRYNALWHNIKKTHANNKCKEVRVFVVEWIGPLFGTWQTAPLSMGPTPAPFV